MTHIGLECMCQNPSPDWPRLKTNQSTNGSLLTQAMETSSLSRFRLSQTQAFQSRRWTSVSFHFSTVLNSRFLTLGACSFHKVLRVAPNTSKINPIHPANPVGKASFSLGNSSKNLMEVIHWPSLGHGHLLHQSRTPEASVRQSDWPGLRHKLITQLVLWTQPQLSLRRKRRDGYTGGHEGPLPRLAVGPAERTGVRDSGQASGSAAIHLVSLGAHPHGWWRRFVDTFEYTPSSSSSSPPSRVQNHPDVKPLLR